MIAQSKIKYTTSFPTSLIVNGLSKFGFELAKTLSEQGGYVIIIDNLEKEVDPTDFDRLKNTSFLDFSAVGDLIEDIRRLDYVFYLNHENNFHNSDLTSQDFLTVSSYLNQVLGLAAEFDALFVITNSVKAHKLLLKSNSFDAKYLRDAGSNYLAYSEAEFVRYAENLVLEYRQARGLEVKILRLGELLGEGVELSEETNIGKLVGQAVNKSHLYLDEDGLSSEHYVHLMDAVYGVIKAQFSKNLKNVIYTVAYEEPVTQLSLAYRIQELEPDAGEIKFVDEENAKVKLDLAVYKAAPNLAEISWRPKVDFNTALAQTLAYAQGLLSGYASDEPEAEGAVEDEEEEPKPLNGALARLIDERKRATEQNKQKQVKGLAHIESKGRNKGTGKVLQRKLIKGLDRFKKNFSFLYRLTLVELGVYSLLTMLFLGIFFTLFAPIVILVRDFSIIDAKLKGLTTAHENQDWATFAHTASDLKLSVSNAKATLENSNILFNVTNRQELQQQLLGVTQAYEFLSDSYVSFGEAMAEVQNFANSNKVELVPRLTNSSVLSVDSTVTGAETTVSASTAQARYDLAARSKDSFERVYAQIDKTALPQFLQTYLQTTYDGLEKYNSQLAAGKNAISFITQIDSSEYNLGIVVQDHLRSNFNGGEVAALGVVTYNSGKITAVSLLPAQNVTLTNPNFNAAEIAEIRAMSQGQVTTITTNNLRQALGFIATTGVRDSAYAKVLSESFNKQINGTLYLNLSSFGDFIRTTGNVELNGQRFSEANYLQLISSLQTNTANSRNTVVANLAALILDDYLSNTSRSEISKVAQLVELQKQNKLGFDSNLANSFGVQILDPEITVAGHKSSAGAAAAVSSFDLNLRTELSGTDVSTKVELKAASASELDRALLCLPATATKLDFGTLAIENYAEVDTEQGTCVIFNTSRIKQYTFSYKDTSEDSEYKSSLGVATGLKLSYDVQVNYPSSYQLVKSVPLAAKNANSVFYTGEVYNQFRFILELKK